MKARAFTAGSGKKLEVEINRMIEEDNQEIIDVITTHEKGVYLILHRDIVIPQ